jgi:predicted DNA binding CopG/RHH family protein
MAEKFVKYWRKLTQYFGLQPGARRCTIVCMAADAFITCRVTSDTKARVRRMAELEGIHESAVIKRLLHGALLGPASVDESFQPVAVPPARQQRVCVRLAAEDRQLLEERAAARGMASATYVALLVRAHLSGAAPLPRAEYLALRQSVLELTAIGRNLNQIARALNQGGSTALPGRAEVAAMLRVAEGLRDHVKELLKVNEASWSRHARTSH